MDSNTKLDLAWDYLNYTDRNIFLTGKAGTGKTTFLHRVKAESLKRSVVVAPTGVAAINAKGVTIHSFFQLPFGPILPETDPSSGKTYIKKFSKNKIDIIKSMDLLIIDEISMVRADLLDGIDQVLRRFRDRGRPFGGVQLLMIGDLQQLSPVIKNEEWQLLQKHYHTGFFFGSKSFMECKAVSIELTQIYRQKSIQFINILNGIRNNTLSDQSQDILNTRYQPDFSPAESEGYITLTTHNYRADNINNLELEKLKGKSMVYKAKVEGRFPEYMYPTHFELQFRIGAQVMFIKNDSSSEKRYYNGKIGKIVALDKNEIVVRCPEEDFDITTTPEIWENINYAVDPETKDIKEDKIGEFMQMPLRLAWAITIHKSQGLTFDKIVVDSKDAFAHGQTYVALSRCKTLEGIVLTSPIGEESIITSNEVTSFNRKVEHHQPTSGDLTQARKGFQYKLIEEIFNFHSFLFPINRMVDIYYKNRGSIQGNILEKIMKIKVGVTALLKINTKFQVQVKALTHSTFPDKDERFQQRFIKAVAYFLQECDTIIKNNLEDLDFSSDNKVVVSDIGKQLENIETLFSAKMYCLQGLRQGYDTNDYLKLRAEAVLQNEGRVKTKKRDILQATEHPDLLQELRDLRTHLSDEEDVPPYRVFTQKALYEMCQYLPTNPTGLRTISDIGKVRLEKYGASILKVIRDYCESRDIELKNATTLPKKKSTAQISYELFKSGKNIDTIAKERNLTTGTIEGHLSQYLVSGEIKITDLMPEAKYKALKKIMETVPFEGFGDLKR